MEAAAPQSSMCRLKSVDKFIHKIIVQREKVSNKRQHSLEHIKEAMTLIALKVAKRAFCNRFMALKKSSLTILFAMWIGKEEKNTVISQLKQPAEENKV